MIVSETQEDKVKAINELLPYQTSDFEELFKIMDGLPVTIRLLDPPLHEFLPKTEEDIQTLAKDLECDPAVIRERITSLKEANPMLGNRGCRLGITKPELTEMQAKAIFTAAMNVTKIGVKVHPKVMIPLAMSKRELEVLKEILDREHRYIEEGFNARSNGKNINKRVVVKSNVNTKKVGNYRVLYNLNIKYINVNKTLVRKVSVRDTKKPNLTINSNREIDYYIGNEFEYPTYAALDEYDGDITNRVKVKTNLDITKEGKYEINYSVKDSSNNEATEKIIVMVNEKRKNPYINVSISNQKLYYYEYGELVLESDVVTGINGKTPTGTFRVLNKIRNTVLKGDDYESFVSYWIAFNGNSYGFHDASWRNKFGGNIYKYNGSHGCVNMPYYKVQSLYNMVEIGTPVYIYY